MAKTVVAFWNCTKSEHWSEASFKNKLTSLHAATFTSQVEVDSKMGKQSRVDTWIFTAPEYAFAQKQVSLEAVVQVKAALSQITSNYRSLLLIAGTIAVKDAANHAQNLCYLLLFDRSLSRGKRDVGCHMANSFHVARTTNFL
jgi:hypothetical protein